VATAQWGFAGSLAWLYGLPVVSDMIRDDIGEMGNTWDAFFTVSFPRRRESISGPVAPSVRKDGFPPSRE
jgi:hypothetical protein